MKRPGLACCLSLLLLACRAAAPAAPDSPGDALPAGERIGTPLEPRAVHTLAELSAAPESFRDRTLLVEATVEAVCQKAGCWMKLGDAGADGAVTAMVRWEEGCGGRYVFPADAVGRRVIVQGSWYPKSISEEDALHIEEEAADGVAIPRETWELNASAILVRD